MGLAVRKKLSIVILTAVATVAFVVVLLITSMQLLCFTGTGWYEHEYNKYEVLENLRGDAADMSMDEVLEATGDLIDYSTGAASELPRFYTEREKAHMGDCKALFLLAFKVRNILFLGIACVVCLLALMMRGRGLGQRNANVCLPIDSESNEQKQIGIAPHKLMLISYIVTLIVIVVAVVIIYLATGGAFGDAFTKFHEIFFDNDLWLLDPREDNLINLLPIGFFLDTVKVIVGMTIAGLAVVGVVLCVRVRQVHE